ncbi:hypothetical protein DPMN_106040 [Dreissena polymorpha]|uniref:Uncharacterized protein n=1 Tax=Dreissena polymorpha TaxID=45954 RepID=A0A9D4K492_DREPO|nr:hypothetical protein DPMN_106040 [Dreissena polymorpha]
MSRKDIRDKDDVLSIFQSDEEEFSGFETEDIPTHKSADNCSPSRAPQKLASKVTKPNNSNPNVSSSGKKKSAKKTEKQKSKEKNETGNLIDLDNLNEDLVIKLKHVLGLLKTAQPSVTVQSEAIVSGEDEPDSDENYSDMTNIMSIRRRFLLRPSLKTKYSKHMQD